MSDHTQPPDTLLHGGIVHTMDDARTTGSTVAITGNRITAVGGPELLELVGPHTSVVDLRGQTVVPGLIDVHTHAELVAHARHLWTDIRNLTVDQLLCEIRRQAATTPPGAWIVLQGTFGQRFPRKTQLDAVAPDHPVALRWTMHKFLLNSCALHLSGINGAFVAPPGVRVHFDAGQPTGLIEEGWDLIASQPALANPMADILEETVRTLYMRHGVTSLSEIAASPSGVAGLRTLATSTNGPEFARVGIALTAPPGHQPMADISALAHTGFGAGNSESKFGFEAVKIFLDGGRDGAFRLSGIDATAHEWGLLTRTPQTLAVEVSEAVGGGIPVWVHAIGDLSQEIAVSAIEQASRAHPGVNHGCRIEHFGNEMYDTKTVDRLIGGGGIAVPNPGFLHAEPTDPDQRLPSGVVKYGLRSLRQAGIRPPGNSDTAGAQPFSCNPWFVMQCMTNRQNKEGILIDADEAVGADEALASFTRDAAQALSCCENRGILAAGRLADLAVLDRDPLTIPDTELSEVTTQLTIINGRVGFRHADAPPELPKCD